MMVLETRSKSEYVDQLQSNTEDRQHAASRTRCTRCSSVRYSTCTSVPVPYMYVGRTEHCNACSARVNAACHRSSVLLCSWSTYPLLLRVSKTIIDVCPFEPNTLESRNANLHIYLADSALCVSCKIMIFSCVFLHNNASTVLNQGRRYVIYNFCSIACWGL